MKSQPFYRLLGLSLLLVLPLHLSTVYADTDRYKQTWDNFGNDIFNNYGSSLSMKNQMLQRFGVENQQGIFLSMLSIDPSSVKSSHNENRQVNRHNALLDRGLVVGHLDIEGVVDMPISYRDSKPELLAYRNTGAEKHRLVVALEGDEALYKMAVGTRVEVTLGSRVYHKVLRAGDPHLYQHKSLLHFAAGKRRIADKVEITWPNGITQTFRKVSIDKPLTVQYVSDIFQ